MTYALVASVAALLGAAICFFVVKGKLSHAKLMANMLKSVILGVEQVSGATEVKTAIRAAALSAGVEDALGSLVKKLTK